MLTLLLLSACQAPFGTNRHYLEGYRVAAVKIDRLENDQVRPSAALIQDGALWSDDPAELHWRWLESTDELAGWGPENLSHGLGAQPVLTLPDGDGDALLGLLALWPDGTLHRSMLTVTRQPSEPNLLSLSLFSTGQTLSDIGADQMPVSARDAWPLTPITAITAGDIVRLDAELSAPLDSLTRWMTLGDQGTFFELNNNSADWAAGVLTFDKEEKIDATAASSGLVSFLGLALSPLGGTDFRTLDVFIGAPTAGVTSTSGRWLKADGPHSGFVWATLVASEEGHSGLALEDIQPATTFSTVDPYHTASLPCEVVPSGPFDPNWLLIGACTRTPLIGARVILELK